MKIYVWAAKHPVIPHLGCQVFQKGVFAADIGMPLRDGASVVRPSGVQGSSSCGKCCTRESFGSFEIISPDLSPLSRHLQLEMME